MAKTISQLPDATSVADGDELIVQQSGVTKRASKLEVIAGIKNASIANDAAIAGSKISPDFAAQNIATTGNVTAAKLIPTGTSATGNGMYLPSSNVVAFSTNGTERARISSGGEFLISRTTVSSGNAGWYFAPSGTARGEFADGQIFALNRIDIDGTAISFARAGVEKGTISVTSSATAYNTSSDYRLKENVEPLAGGLAKLKSLAPKTFEFKSDFGVKVDGFLAHEVQSVVPQAVTGEKDGEQMQGLDMSKLVPVLVAAVQELSARVEALEAANA